MAANFWTSQHHRTLLQEVSQEHHQPDIERGLTTDDVRGVKAFFVGYLFQLVAAMSEKQKMRQQVACSAATFFHRFYSKNSFSEHDPRLIAPCCLYLAGKVEENLVNAAVLEHQLRARPFSLGVKVEATTLVDLELLLLDVLDYNLVVFSPRQALHAYLRDLGTVPDQGKLAKCALAVLNDSFWSDASLVYNPPTLALASLIVAGMFTGAEEKLPGWLAKLQQADLEQTHAAVQKLLYLYQHDKFRMQQSRVLHLLSCTAQS